MVFEVMVDGLLEGSGLRLVLRRLSFRFRALALFLSDHIDARQQLSEHPSRFGARVVRAEGERAELAVRQ